MTQVPSLGQEDPLEEGMATHSRILAWRIPGTEETGGLQSIGLQSQARLKRLSTYADRISPGKAPCGSKTFLERQEQLLPPVSIQWRFWSPQGPYGMAPFPHDSPSNI